MNILFIVEKNWQIKNLFEIHTIPEGLSARGHNVYVLDYNENWRNYDSNRFLQSRVLNTQVSRTSRGEPIGLFRPFQISLPLLARISSAVDFPFLLHYIIKRKSIDIVFLYAVPTYGMQALMICRFHKTPIVFRSIDYISSLVPNLALQKPTQWLERLVYRRVDAISTHNPALSDYITGFGVVPSKIQIQPAPVDIESFNRCEIENQHELREKWGIDMDDRVILFVGALFESSGVDDAITQFNENFSGHPNVKLMIIGAGELFDRCKAIVKAHRLESRVIMTGYQHFSLIPAFLNMSAVCIVPFKANRLTHHAMPEKIIQYLACSKPVVSTSIEGAMRVFPDQDAGIIFTEEKHLMQIVYELINNRYLAHQLGKQGYEFVKAYFDWISVINQLETYLRRLLR